MSSTINEDKYIKLYSDIELDQARIIKLKEFIDLFQEKTQDKPDYVVCVPGRVNLIGDHIDYHGFAVLPMAIENSIWFGCSITNPKATQAEGDSSDSDSVISLFNRENKQFPAWSGKHSFSYGSNLDKSHEWQNYILCGYHGILAKLLLNIQPDRIFEHAKHISSNKELLDEVNKELERMNNFKVVIDSNLPKASGLSSSSALVCASAIATCLLIEHSKNNAHLDISPTISLNSLELAECCSKFEHLIGTHGGGMDQAVIMTAQEGYAKYVEFDPKLRCENIHLPDNIIWFISHCGADYPKAATSGFNARVLETKLGAALIVKSSKHNLKLDKTLTLGKVKNLLFKDMTTSKLLSYIQSEVFNNINEFTVEEICTRLGISRNQLIERFQTSDEFLRNSLNDRLQLLNRCEHVFEEAERVEKFKSSCDTTIDFVLLGQLMTQSHYSLRDKYDCSHPALDRLVSVALDAGALGSRLTGAGWGGCVVTMVEASRGKTVCERLKEVSKFTFRTEPRPGCSIIKITK